MSDEHSETPTSPPAARDEKGRFLKGSTGNPGGLPGGRPRGSGFMAELQRQLEAEADDGRTRQERIIAKLIVMAEEGDTRAAELILKRIAPERLALESDGLPLVLLRNFAGVADPDVPQLAPPAELPVIEANAPEAEDLPEGAERLPDGSVRWRISH